MITKMYGMVVHEDGQIVDLDGTGVYYAGNSGIRNTIGAYLNWIKESKLKIVNLDPNGIGEDAYVVIEQEGTADVEFTDVEKLNSFLGLA
jgi:hypothetical protein